MRVGNLRHTISIQEPIETSDGLMGKKVFWKDVTGLTKLKAAIWPLKGEELIEAMKLDHKLTHRIVTRYRAKIKPKMRVVFGSLTFNIRSLINTEMRNERLEMLCEEEI